MNIDAQTIDRIVAGVLKQLSAKGNGAPAVLATETRRQGDGAEHSISREAAPSGAGNGVVAINASVITADVLPGGVNNETRVIVPLRAIVTPAAWDAASERGLEIIRDNAGLAAPFTDAADNELRTAAARLLIVVRHTDAVGRLAEDLRGRWRREPVDCPDDAAALAISGICRGDASMAMIFAEQAHRAACLANRNERVKAAAIRDAVDVPIVRRQLRANVWCLDPTGRGWFELRRLLQAIEAEETRR